MALTTSPRRVALIASAAAAVLAVTAAPAAAHYTYAYQGDDLGSISSSHLQATACDQENDNRAVYVQVITSSGSRDTVWDYYGGGCTTGNLISPAVNFRVCEQIANAADACTSWRDA
ncbi:hypothetical protein [Bailinhaonella thermotolerans]|uniref:Uncharacterized protein n=1 Tax=Bailinhaonella thermotolerans TaxID=1070861 RepID=A0A3A4B5E8_9ACTN|nr:hypothetical protein [Bailinhaonella thermotolerans]RJL35850.1 hypothetical protein D5H75_03485 [Bailinhaonella thermotolerans]